MITFTRCAFMAKQACATFSQVVQKITPPIANNFLKFFFALFATLTLNAATAWAEDYSIKFLTNTNDGSTEITSSTRTSTVLESASCSNVSGFTNNCTKAYYKGKSGVKLSSGSASGTLELTLSDVCNKNVSKVVFKTAKYNSESSTLTFYAGTSKLGTVAAGNEFSYTFTEPQSISTLKISSTKRAYVSEITISVNSAVTPESGTGKTATYTVSSATAVTATGNIPQGSTATLSGTGSLNGGFIQCTNGKNHTLTLTGYEGYKITGVTIHVKSNSSKGTGSFSVVAGSKTIANVVESAFNSTNWNGSWNNSGVDKVLTMTDNSYEIKTGENVKLTINCKSGSSDYNSLYVKSYTITYMPVTSSGSGSTEPVVSLTNEQLKWSATTATALKGADNNEFPTLTNALDLTVTYDSSNKDAATIAADGTITLVAPGATTISAKFAGGEVDGTTYSAKTVTYTLTVKQLVSCADIYNLADNATFVLKDFVVTYVNGDYTYIKDDDGYGLIFTKDASDYDLKAGDKVASGKFEGKKTTYRTLVEIIPVTAYDNLNATSGAAPSPEIMATNPTDDNINKYVKFEKVKFTTTKLNSTTKSILGTIEGETDAITFYNQYGADVTFNTSKKYDIVGVVSIYDSKLQVNFISAEEVAEPTLNVKITDADFGKVAINGTRERTLTLNGSLLTKPVSLAIEGEGAEYFKLSSYSVNPTDGNITNAKITITYKPTAEGIHTTTLKITSDDVAEQTITLRGQAVQQHTVDFYVNKEKQTELAKKVLSGEKLIEIPTATSCDPLEYPTFIGWSASEITGTTDVEPTDLLDLNTTITTDCKYYAVFAKETSSTTSTGITYEVTLKNTNFVTNYNDRTINITANEVGGDGTVEVSFQSVGVMKCTDASKGAVMQFRKKSSSSQPGIIYNTTDLGQINSITIGTGGTNNIASIVIGSTQQPTTQEDNEGFFLITNGTSVSYIPSITINFTQNSSASTTTYTYLTTCESATPTYTVTYNLDGGESTCETSVVVEQDGELTLCDAPTKIGHKFLKWKDQNDHEYAAGAKITVSVDLTLTAQWQVNSYEVTWMSLGDEVLVNSADYNTQPTKPTTAPTYTCSIGTKEFVGWSTQEIDGAGVPANLYTDEFPVVTEAITYHAVFASKIEGGGSMSKAVSLTNGETVYLATESGIGVTGANTSTNKDATVSTTQGDWMPFTVVTNGLQYQFKNGDNYIKAAAKSFKITETPSDFAFENGYIVYNVPSGSDAGDYVLLVNNNDAINTYYRFYKESNMSNSKYETFYVYKKPIHTDYTTSCPVLELTEGENTLTDGVTADVKVNRSFTTGNLYTISLPFTLENVSSVFGNQAYEYTSLAKDGNDVVLYFNKVNTIEAGKPYLIEPTKDVLGFSVDNVTLSNATNNISFRVGTTTVDMEAVLSAGASDMTNGKYWLASDRYLYNNETRLLGLRAVFNINSASGIAPRARVAFRENTTTGLSNITNDENTTIKVIENGQLIIIRNGEKFNAQGIKF